MNGYYILNEKGDPQKVNDVIEWGMWLENAENRILKQTTLENGVFVSTVFLGIDHNFSNVGSPILWETMAFHVPNGDDYQTRHKSPVAALYHHENLIIYLRRNANTIKAQHHE